ncbi:MAG TPA: hypothetical protein PLS03_00535 [Terrimicrobiaceae bacterium]|nr:hypothetical protein [Terrimicrobiaceae bacterium]
MQIAGKSIDDFKTERKGISPPLPVYLRLVPLVFYLGILATILLNGLFFVGYSQANLAMLASQKRDQELKAALAVTKQKRTELENEAKKASDIVAWIEAARPLQPLIVQIARSMEPGASIIELRLDRNAENPAQILFTLRLSSDSTRQLDLTLAKIADQNFRMFSPQQSLAKGELEYQATLMWQDPARVQVPEKEAVK